MGRRHVDDCSGPIHGGASRSGSRARSPTAAVCRDRQRCRRITPTYRAPASFCGGRRAPSPQPTPHGDRDQPPSPAPGSGSLPENPACVRTAIPTHHSQPTVPAAEQHHPPRGCRTRAGCSSATSSARVCQSPKRGPPPHRRASATILIRSITPEATPCWRSSVAETGTWRSAAEFERTCCARVTAAEQVARKPQSSGPNHHSTGISTNSPRDEALRAPGSLPPQVEAITGPHSAPQPRAGRAPRKKPMMNAWRRVGPSRWRFERDQHQRGHQPLRR